MTVTDTETLSTPFTGAVAVNSGGSLTISGAGAVNGQVVVNAGGSLTLTDGGSVSCSNGYAIVTSGTVNVFGGSVTSPGTGAIIVDSGMLTVSGGSLTGPFGVIVEGGTVNISGGTITGYSLGVLLDSGTVSISGFCLRLLPTTINGWFELKGMLADGSPIDTKTKGLTASDLISTCDTSAPTTTATATAGGNPYAAGTWTNTKTGVTVSLKATDPDDTSTKSDVQQFTYSASGAQTIGTTVVAGAAATVPTINTEGTTTVSFFATDKASNEETLQTFVVKIDQTPPVVSYSGNAGTYTVDQTVNITCSASDALSGVASSTCRNITGPAYSFNLGLNSFSAQATDHAGNTGSGSTHFTVQATPGSLSRLVTQFVTDPSVAQGLNDKLAAIAAAVAQGNAAAKAGAVSAFISQVNAQTGKSITAQQAAILIRLVQAL
jgi:hypothetical protein